MKKSLQKCKGFCLVSCLPEHQQKNATYRSGSIFQKIPDCLPLYTRLYINSTKARRILNVVISIHTTGVTSNLQL
jgi:hypothetical protein